MKRVNCKEDKDVDLVSKFPDGTAPMGHNNIYSQTICGMGRDQADLGDVVRRGSCGCH